ncbi:MAG: hypothetical protein H6812_08420 [Phycisphaeraceae bacterium]|nr:hypothetical protein [Phycisphaerales bacterium]MCB9843268.1 hypothetical protein [Phycisphaeraceae bacterium]
MTKRHESGVGSGTSPFGVLGLVARFDLDPAAIDSAWLRAAAMCHPDRVGDEASGGGRTIAAVNRARAALSDPERRAEALLTHLGGASREEDNALPEGFLMEIFSVRQELEEAKETGDGERIASFERWADGRREEYIREVSERFNAVGSPPQAERLAQIRRTLNAWRYIERMIEQLAD